MVATKPQESPPRRITKTVSMDLATVEQVERYALLYEGGNFSAAVVRAIREMLYREQGEEEAGGRVSAPAWVPQAPHAEPARDLMPPESRALLRRLDRLAERLLATYPAHAEAVRRSLATKEADDGGAA
jgi:hypothetical protein